MEAVLILALAVAATALIGTAIWKKSTAAEREALEKVAPLLDGALSRQRELLDLNSGYLMKRDWDAARADSQALYDALSKVRDELREDHPRAADIAEFMRIHADEDIRIARNAEYKEAELTAADALLSDIDGKSLDGQQRDAVVTDEYSNLVIAGAGSGKTLTVVGKIKYLIERRGLAPEEILVTSFTRKSVQELAERIERAGIEGVACRTFHKIGLDQLGAVGVANENELKNCVLGYLREGILAHPDQMSAYIEFYGCFKHIPKDYSEYDVDGERMEALKATDLTTIKGQLDTLNGERVKSLEELMIANFLFLNGVAYEYEKNYTGTYETEGRAYQPDFYLSDYDIWLEHFGVNEQNRCPWIATPIEEQKYIDGMKWKRQVHAANGTRLIESYSYWNKDHDLLNKLRSLLEANGVALAEDEGMLSRVYERLSFDDRYLRSVASLVTTFLSLAKANNVSMAEVSDRAREAYKGDGYMWHRYDLFASFAEPIMELYQTTLTDKGQVDFDDMINAAAAKIAEEGFSERYRYIIVDEYQDISRSRFGLISAIRDATGAHLMCVGDDWQSIYRFAGSDVSLFTDFGDYVGYHETMRIERTYRNSQELVDIASAFIERNPAQIHKVMRSDKHEKAAVNILYDKDMGYGLLRALVYIWKNRNGAPGSVLVLGRHNFDIETAFPAFRGELSYSNGSLNLTRNRKTGDVMITVPEIGLDDVTFMSAHRAKGLEADDVVVLNLNNGMYGFPNRVEDDPILGILLGGKGDSIPFAEERRLFYVALTRTKNSVHLVAGSLEEGCGPSPFVEELKSSAEDGLRVYRLKHDTVNAESPVLCPCCGTGRLVVRTNSQTGKSFLGCSNYPFCERSYSQTEILSDRIECPSCGGWLVRRRRESDGSPFFGCSNYPVCNATIDATDDFKPIYAPKEPVRGSDTRNSRARCSDGSACRQKGPGKCPKCGADLKLLRNGSDGSHFYGCTRYPKCDYTRNTDDKSKPGKCPRCGAPLKELTNSQDGSVFYGCTQYPKCKYTRSKR